MLLGNVGFVSASEHPSNGTTKSQLSITIASDFIVQHETTPTEQENSTNTDLDSGDNSAIPNTDKVKTGYLPKTGEGINSVFWIGWLLICIAMMLKFIETKNAKGMEKKYHEKI